jgi:hypothetical protein
MAEPEADGAPDPVAAALELNTTLQGLTKQFERLQRSEKWWRRIVIGLAVSLTLDVALTGGLGYNTLRQDATQSASHADLIAACQQANVNRSQDIAVWDDILTLPPGATAAQRARVADIAGKVRAKDRLRDCAALYATNP